MKNFKAQCLLLILLLLITVSTRLPAQSLTIHVDKPGSLPLLVGAANQYTTESLTVTGTLNWLDIQYLNRMCDYNISMEEGVKTGSLKQLDMKEARIVYQGNTKYNDIDVFEGWDYTDDELPPSAFEYCTSLEEIILPDSLRGIWAGTFHWCDNLKSIVIPEGTRFIEYMAFTDCDKLESVKLPETLQYIGEIAFQNCHSLRQITIPTSVDSIGRGMFRDCWALESVELPDSVRCLGSNAFYDCHALKSLKIPKGVKTVDHFKYCISLEHVELPEGVTEIGMMGFYVCRSLKEIHLPSTLTFIDGEAFYRCESLDSIEIPDFARTLYGNEFAYCTNLKYAKLSQHTGTISGGMFSGCSQLATVVFPPNVTQIEAGAFYQTALTEVTIPWRVKTIGASAFQGCVNLKSLTFATDQLTEIGNQAFAGCDLLDSISLPASVKELGYGAFAGTPIRTVILPENLSKIGEQAFADCPNLQKIVSLRPKPANGYENTFSDDAHERVPVYVDEEQLYHYQVSLLFRLFKNLIGVPKEILGISHLEAYDAVRPVRYYRLNGTSGSHPGKGLNIMLDRGGRRKKIVSTTH